MMNNLRFNSSINQMGLLLAVFILGFSEPVNAIQTNTSVAQSDPGTATNSPTRLIVQETIFSQDCDPVIGEITAQDRIGIDEQFQDVGMRYDSFPLPSVNGLLVFVELKSQDYEASAIVTKAAIGSPRHSVTFDQDGNPTTQKTANLTVEPIRRDQQDGENSVALAYYVQGLEINANDGTANGGISLKLGTFEDEKFGRYSARLALALATDKLTPEQIEEAVKALSQDEIHQLVNEVCDGVAQSQAASIEAIKKEIQELTPRVSAIGGGRTMEEHAVLAERLVELYQKLPENEKDLSKFAHALYSAAFANFVVGWNIDVSKDPASAFSGSINGEPFSRDGRYVEADSNRQKASPYVQQLIDLIVSGQLNAREDVEFMETYSQYIGEFFEYGPAPYRYPMAQYWYLRSLYFRILSRQSLEEHDIFSVKSSLAWSNVGQDLALSLATESQRLSELSRMQQNVDFVIGLHLHLAPDSNSMARLAYGTILNRKGRLLDASVNTLQLVRRESANNPELAKLVTQLEQLSRDISNLTTQSQWDTTDTTLITADEDTIRLRQKEAEREALVAQLSNSSAKFREQYSAITFETLKQQIPRDAALVEFFKYRWQNKEYYGAYIFRASGQVKGIDLGEADPIEQSAKVFYESLANPAQADSVKSNGKDLYERVMAEVARQVKDGEQLLIAPDGALNQIPFEALVDQTGDYLLKRYRFSYLASGRDLTRLQTSPTDRSRQPPVLVGNPLYAEDTSPSQTLAALFSTPVPAQPVTVSQAVLPDHENSRYRSSETSTALRDLKFADKLLPQSEPEIRKLQSLLPDAAVLLGANAAEPLIKQVRAPRILHISTHGFYLPNELQRSLTGETAITQTITNPMLRSALALSGFDQRQSGDDDGMLTALEISELDLNGTELVVLSACETGLGDIAAGEGIYGLRRALALAGAESQVVSLWKVIDDSVPRIMGDYYANLLQKGQGRHEALRQVQIAMANEGKSPHLWAAFIASGDWRPLPENPEN